MKRPSYHFLDDDEKMKVLYCSYEVAPFFKKGGLGDVAGSLPKALKKLGVDIKVVMPRYNIKNQKLNIKNTYQKLKIEFNGREEKISIWETFLPGTQVPIYLLENKKYLSELKKGEECLDQFAFFSKAIAEFATGQFDLIHLNDWHTALVALLLKLSSSNRPATLLTVHNFAHQGIAPLSILAKLGISKGSSRVISWDVADEDFEILMEGIIHSDIVNTVSPTYAKEILDPKFWGRLSEVLKGKEGRVEGILNGIDYDVWNPRSDKSLAVNYQSNSKPQLKTKNWKEGKRLNKLALQKELGLEVNAKVPLLGMISRLARKQKGLDILYGALVDLLPKGEFQFVLLGVGGERVERKFARLAKIHHNFEFINRFDEPLAHRIYGGADFILVPSRFEPCGLSQMIAMRYGALPLVRETGGLRDTVKEGINGFVFEEYSPAALTDCIERAIKKFKVEKARFKIMVEKAMSEDFSWKASAFKYLKLYRKAIAISK